MAATTVRYQQWHCGVAAKDTESPWENGNLEQPFQTIVVEAGLGMIFLLQTPIVNYYSHGLPIYQTHKT
jgi:nitric oxide reductase large subunit